jgi:hypothetical protein
MHVHRNTHAFRLIRYTVFYYLTPLKRKTNQRAILEPKARPTRICTNSSRRYSYGRTCVRMSQLEALK